MSFPVMEHESMPSRGNIPPGLLVIFWTNNHVICSSVRSLTALPTGAGRWLVLPLISVKPAELPSCPSLHAGQNHIELSKVDTSNFYLRHNL